MEKRFVNGGKPGPGRPKGKQAKHTIAFKDAVEAAADKLGGVNRMVAWAQEDPQNERIFWGNIFPKLAPLQVTGANGASLIPPMIQFVRGEG